MNLSDLVICTDGSITPCCLDFNRSLIIGNINETALDMILICSKVNELQEKHAQKNISGLVCEQCDHIRRRENPLIYSNGGMEVGKSSMQIFKSKRCGN
jgi:radical SAM protein with 4Fe4S-binding SPASM domain